jgi:periplasmic divalent cation tolerance protein
MHIVVLVTAPSLKTAETIAKFLLLKKLAACVNIVAKVDSLFWWQKKIDKAKESLLIIKTQKKLFGKLAKAVKSRHPYEVPEIIALPIILGNRKYLGWIDESCR